MDNTGISVYTGTIISDKLLKILIVIRIISNLNCIKLDIILIEILYIVNNNCKDVKNYCSVSWSFWGVVVRLKITI